MKDATAIIIATRPDASMNKEHWLVATIIGWEALPTVQYDSRGRRVVIPKYGVCTEAVTLADATRYATDCTIGKGKPTLPPIHRLTSSKPLDYMVEKQLKQPSYELRCRTCGQKYFYPDFTNCPGCGNTPEDAQTT